jgi:hypothetical protein
MGRCGSRAWRRSAAATLTGPARHSTPMTRLRNVAMTCGPLPLRTCEASSAKVTSRMWCSASIAQCPRSRSARPAGAGLLERQAGDRVDGHGLEPPRGGQGTGLAGDLEDLAA